MKFIGTWNGIKMHVSAHLRTKKMMPWKLIEFIWRRKHADNEWDSLVQCLKEVSFQPSNSPLDDHAVLTEVIEEISTEGKIS